MGKIKTQEDSCLNTASKVGIFASSLLIAATAVYIWSPITGSHADSNASEETQVNLNVAPAISLAMNDVFEATATSSIVSINISGTATTNDKSGFTVIMSDQDADTNMVNIEHPTKVISSLTSTETNPGTLPENTWGYMRVHMGGGSKVFPIPTLNNPETIYQFMHPGTNSFQVPLYFRISQNLTAGTYVDILTFTAYVNSVDYVPSTVDPATLATIQDYDCSGLSVGQSTYVKDSRDNNIYKVGKLADGRCWMLNNLKIVDKTITSADSDVTSDFTIPASNLAVNWKLMDVPRAYKSPVSNYGTYYNWYTATAGTGLATTSGGQDAPSSVCPKGWKLPNRTEYEAMLAAYDGQTAAIHAAFASTMHGEVDYFQPRWPEDPNYYEGQVTAVGSGLNDQSGYYWSSTVRDSAWWDSDMGGNGYWSAYNLLAVPVGSSSDPNVSGWKWSELAYDRKHYGDAVRCVARAEITINLI